MRIRVDLPIPRWVNTLATPTRSEGRNEAGADASLGPPLATDLSHGAQLGSPVPQLGIDLGSRPAV